MPVEILHFDQKCHVTDRLEEDVKNAWKWSWLGWFHDEWPLASCSVNVRVRVRVEACLVQHNFYAVVHGACAEQPRHVNLKKGTASQGVLNKRWVMTVMYACS